MQTLEQVIESISKSVASPELRDVRLEIGECNQQGDVYLHRVEDKHPRGKLLGTRQIAVGEGVGSRHIVEGAISVYEGKKLPEWVKPPSEASVEDLLGPVVVVEADGVLTHPKHAHFACHAGTYQVTYPFDHVTKRREQD